MARYRITNLHPHTPRHVWDAGHSLKLIPPGRAADIELLDGCALALRQDAEEGVAVKIEALDAAGEAVLGATPVTQDDSGAGGGADVQGEAGGAAGDAGADTSQPPATKAPAAKKVAPKPATK